MHCSRKRPETFHTKSDTSTKNVKDCFGAQKFENQPVSEMTKMNDSQPENVKDSLCIGKSQ